MSDTKTLTFRMTRYLEGGWYDGSEDYDRNPTKWGATQETFEFFGFEGSVEFMTEEECEIIYESYWIGSKAGMFGALSAPAVFDHAFNAGYRNMRPVVQRALGVVDDGIWGPRTLRAIITANDRDLAIRLSWERMDYYRKVARNKRKRPALLSWVTRMTVYYRRFLQGAI